MDKFSKNVSHYEFPLEIKVVKLNHKDLLNLSGYALLSIYLPFLLCIIYVGVAKTVDLKRSKHTKIFVTVSDDGSQLDPLWGPLSSTPT